MITTACKRPFSLGCVPHTDRGVIRSAHQKNAKNESNFGVSLVKMPQWPALRKRLECVGAQFGARFSDADLAEMKTWRANQIDMRAYVWDSMVVSERTAAGLNAATIRN